MKTFKIIALSVGGKGNRIFNSGDIINEDLFIPNSVQSLVSRGSIKLHGETRFAHEIDVEFIAPERFKVAIITAMWQRPEVFKIFGKLTNKLISEVKDVDFQVFCVGSEGETSRKLAKSFGFKYIEYPNQQLSDKWNAVVTASKGFNPDYCLMMGSDDVMDVKLFRRYLPYMRNGIDFIGVLDWYFYELESKRSIYWKGYRANYNRGKTCGAGRMVSNRLLNKLDFMPWKGNRRGKGLDSTMESNLSIISYSKAAFMIGDGSNGIGVDIKSETNLNSFHLWDNCEEINSKIINKLLK